MCIKIYKQEMRTIIKQVSFFKKRETKIKKTTTLLN